MQYVNAMHLKLSFDNISMTCHPAEVIIILSWADTTKTLPLPLLLSAETLHTSDIRIVMDCHWQCR